MGGKIKWIRLVEISILIFNEFGSPFRIQGILKCLFATKNWNCIWTFKNYERDMLRRWIWTTWIKLWHNLSIFIEFIITWLFLFDFATNLTHSAHLRIYVVRPRWQPDSACKTVVQISGNWQVVCRSISVSSLLLANTTFGTFGTLCKILLYFV